MLGLNYLAWLGILVWVVVPLVAALTAWLIWRRSGTLLNKALALAAGFAILATPTWVSNGVKAHYDRQVRELCAKDGGVRVYETVRLPVLEFELWRNSGGFSDNKPMDSYFSNLEINHIRWGNPDLMRYNYRIVRRSDGKVLGESIRYVRSGGDLPGPWERGTSFSCPPQLDFSRKLQSSIFQKETEK
jgi:hypothetical protein